MNHPTESQASSRLIPFNGWSHKTSCALVKLHLGETETVPGGRMRRKRGLECLHGSSKVDGFCWFYHMTKGFLWFIEFLFEKNLVRWWHMILWNILIRYMLEPCFYLSVWGEFLLRWSDTSEIFDFLQLLICSFSVGLGELPSSCIQYIIPHVRHFCFSDVNQRTSEWMKHTW